LILKCFVFCQISVAPCVGEWILCVCLWIMGQTILKNETRSTWKEPFRSANFSLPVITRTGFVSNTGLRGERPTMKVSRYSERLHTDHCLTMEHIVHALENKFPCFPDNLIPSKSSCMVSIVGSSPSKLRALYAFQILGN